MNVLIIMSDEQRQDTLGCYGNHVIKTPHIDKLAESGTVFHRAYTPYPLCCPARTSLWTGVMPHRHNAVGNWRHILEDYAGGEMIKAFVNAGYHTSYTGKWHVPGTTPKSMGFAATSAIPAVLDGRDKGRYIPDYRQYATAQGYELVPGHGENSTPRDVAALEQPGKAPACTAEIPLEHFLETWQTETFIQTLSQRPKDKPFFAVCSYNAPHFPMAVPAPYDSMYAPEDVILPPNFRTGMEGKPEAVSSKYFTPYENLSEYEWRRLIAHYWGFCTMVDDKVGEIVSYLEKEGCLDDTIIVYTTDHGDMMGSHGLNMKGFPMHYEEDLLVPLIIHDPRQGRRVDYHGYASLMDIMPTVMELTDVNNIPGGIDGLSYRDVCVGQVDLRPRSYVIAETFKFNDQESGNGDKVDIRKFDPARDSTNLSIRDDEFTYIFHWNCMDELYDRKNDPYENINLIVNSSYSDTVSKRQNMLTEDIARTVPEFAEKVEKRMKKN